MSLDKRYILASDLQSLYRDKDTGEPLRAGTITFYKDTARTVKKPVFQLTGSPGSYTYTELPNPVTLSSGGTFEDDNGNDIVPYWFPYESTDADAPIELYYVVVKSQGGVEQFTRQAWPNTVADTIESQTDFINYIPDGQFLLHNNVTPVEGKQEGEITALSTELTPGGWSFERDSSTATDIVLFKSFGSYVTTPTKSPKYYVELTRQAPSGTPGALRALRIRWKDVNKFANETNTYYIEGQSSGSPATVNIYLYKYYGSGGSSPDATLISTMTFGTTWTKQYLPIPFGNNTGKTIGSNGDDYVAFDIRLEADTVSTIRFTDAVHTPGDVEVTTFPTTPDNDFSAKANAGWLPPPNPDGSDRYLPIRQGINGYEFDTSQIGKIYAVAHETVDVSEVECHGQSLDSTGYSSGGVPYSRTYAKIGHKWGTGSNYVSAVLTGDDSSFIITTNTAGSTSNIDAATSGFTVSTLHTGALYAINCYLYQVDLGGVVHVIAIDENYGAVTSASNAGSATGLVITEHDNSAIQRQVFTIQINSKPTGGQYILFSTVGGTNYYMWFTVNGAGADPAVGGRTGIHVEIPSGYDEQDFSTLLASSINGGHVSRVVATAASSISAGAYFIFYTATSKYVVWYKKDGLGSQPSVVGTVKYIQVTITTGETAIQVGQATAAAINAAYFGVPDLRNQFLRGWDGSSSLETNVLPRYSLFPSDQSTFNKVGTYQWGQYQNHLHSLSYTGTTPSYLTNDPAAGFVFKKVDELTPTAVDWRDRLLPTSTNKNGYEETRPQNAAVNFVMKI